MAEFMSSLDLAEIVGTSGRTIHRACISLLKAEDDPFVQWLIGHFFIVLFGGISVFIFIKCIVQVWRGIALSGAECCDQLTRFVLGAIRISFLALIGLIFARWTTFIVEFVYTTEVQEVTAELKTNAAEQSREATLHFLARAYNWLSS